MEEKYTLLQNQPTNRLEHAFGWERIPVYYGGFTEAWKLYAVTADYAADQAPSELQKRMRVANFCKSSDSELKNLLLGDRLLLFIDQCQNPISCCINTRIEIFLHGAILLL